MYAVEPRAVVTFPPRWTIAAIGTFGVTAVIAARAWRLTAEREASVMLQRIEY